MSQIDTALWKHKAVFIHPTLAIDFVYHQTSSSKALVHISGTHGVEGYIGSDIQHQLLSEIKTAPSINVIFIHALNPWGMQNYQRTNKNNVDLNRNYFNDYSTLPENKDFDRYLKLLEAKNLISYYWQIAKLLPQLLSQGMEPFSRTIAMGQHHRPESLFYGGKERQAEISAVLNFLKENFPQLEEVVTVDVHTGLGAYNTESLILDDKSSPEEKKFFSEKFLTPVIDPKVTRGFYRCYGLLSQAFKNLWKEKKVFSIYQEFGTGPNLKSLRALISGHPKLMLQNYYPSSQEWRENCLQLGMKRFLQILSEENN